MNSSRERQRYATKTDGMRCNCLCEDASITKMVAARTSLLPERGKVGNGF